MVQKLSAILNMRQTLISRAKCLFPNWLLVLCGGYLLSMGEIC